MVGRHKPSFRLLQVLAVDVVGVLEYHGAAGAGDAGGSLLQQLGRRPGWPWQAGVVPLLGRRRWHELWRVGAQSGVPLAGRAGRPEGGRVLVQAVASLGVVVGVVAGVSAGVDASADAGGGVDDGSDKIYR